MGACTHVLVGSWLAARSRVRQPVSEALQAEDVSPPS
jgi:hypothetical protein